MDEIKRLSDRLDFLNTERAELVKKQQEVQADLANKDLRDTYGRRVDFLTYNAHRSGLIRRQSELQSELSRIKAERSQVSDELQRLKEAKGQGSNPQLQRAARLVLRLVAIIDRIGEAKLTDAEADILDEAVEFAEKHDG